MTNTENATESKCKACGLASHQCDVPHTIEEHKVLGLACYACRDTYDTAARILVTMASAANAQLNQRTLARKLGRPAMSLNRSVWALSRAKLIERAYKNVHEQPSGTTYRLTDAGKQAAQNAHYWQGVA